MDISLNVNEINGTEMKQVADGHGGAMAWLAP
jgi:hypothetical protein